MNAQENQPSNKKRSRAKAILLLIAVFGLGAITGVGGSVIITVNRIKHNLRNPDPANGPADRVLKRIGNRLEKDLDLTEEENRWVREELVTTRDQLGEVRMKLRKDIEAVIHDTVARIENRLPEGKRAELQRKADEFLEHWGMAPAE